ncbi:MULTISPECIES: non-ribosomal peptide synthetase [unclassified Nocardia]|uniref:non-ribosomal peptide synthetase n=1 Tax=unclassified Nocardia TaxID=2637762 RepID=UPI00278BF421|nr:MULTISPECIES: non-ribosomal peptide synthetase [unclassified Nocardia]
MESAQSGSDATGAAIGKDEIRTAIATHLGLDPADIADGDDLIQLGLDSIRTMKLAGGWRKRGIAVNFAQLAAEPTVADWYRLLGGDPAAPEPDRGAGAHRAPTEIAGAAADGAAAAVNHADSAAGGYSAAAHGENGVAGDADAQSDGAAKNSAASGRAAARGSVTAAGGSDPVAVPDPVAAGGSGAVASGADGADTRPDRAAVRPQGRSGAPVGADGAAAGADAAADDGSPFPLAPMQHAYWIGRSEGQQLGAVAAHLYVEFDGGDVDPGRLERAAELLVARHPMLRTRFLPDGTQQTLERPGRPVWSVTDLRDRDAAEVERVLAALRDGKTHQLMAVEDGQVIDIALTLLPGGRTRLHLDVDMLAADAMSYRILVGDLARLYHGEELPPQTYTFREYLAGQAAPGPDHARARDWWQRRLPELPGAPELPRASELTHATAPAPASVPASAAVPVPAPASGSAAAPASAGAPVPEAAPASADVDSNLGAGERLSGISGGSTGVDAGHSAEMRTVRFHRWLSPTAKARMFAAAHTRGITPAMALASVFAETIGGWSARRRFLLNLPLFHREPVHPQVDGVVGDFTSSVLLEVDVTEPATVTERAQALQRELHAAGAHSAYSGLEVLRDLGRLRGEPVLAPIVYTSAINLGELFAEHVTDTFGDPAWIISQGPQVLLDAQVTEVRGGLLLNWDVRASAFPAGMVEAMFARYIDAILRLAGITDSSEASETIGGAGTSARAATASAQRDGAALGTADASQSPASRPAYTAAARTWTAGMTATGTTATGAAAHGANVAGGTACDAADTSTPGITEHAAPEAVADGAHAATGIAHSVRATEVAGGIADAAGVTEVAGGIADAAGASSQPGADLAAQVDAMEEAVAAALSAARPVDNTETGWDAEATVRIPLEQAVVRSRVNATSGPVSGRTLHAGLFQHAAVNPDAPAVIWETDAEPGSGATAFAHAVAGRGFDPAAGTAAAQTGARRGVAGSEQEHAHIQGERAARTDGRPDGQDDVRAADRAHGERAARAHTLTYGELAAQALAVAGALRAAGVRPGDAVAVQLPKGPDQIVATLGVLAAGGVYVPIGFDQPAARRAEIIRTGDVVAALTAGVEVPEVRTLALAGARVFAEPLAEPVFPDPEAIAYVLFTSGSTGKPKGVEVPHRAAMNTIDDLDDRFDIGPADRALALSALEFDLSVYDIFGLFAVGGAVLAVDETQRAEPARWLELIERHRVSVLNCVPSLLDMLLSAASGRRLDSLRMVILGGDWVDVALPGRVRQVAPDCRFAGLGGATETAIHSTICEVVDARVPAEWSAVPYGTPLRNVRCRVVGPAGHDCPDWVTGELWIGGDGVAAGYRNDPERTADRFVTHEGLRWYRTGDLARYLPDGTLEFLGRADHQVKIRGYRVELGEVESALRALPGVRHAIAAVIGSAAPKLAAVVVGVEGAELRVEALLAQAADLLPAYMIPARVELLAELPFTANGKPDRKAIATLLAAGERVSEFVAPRTDLERALADIVAAVLGRDRVGATDDFFALGGDSVLATAVVARVREWLDSPDTVVADFFAARTVAGLARRLLEREQRTATPGRLATVAAMYLEVAALSDEEVLAQR